MITIKGTHKEIIERILHHRREPVFALRDVVLELEGASKDDIIAALTATDKFKFETYVGESDLDADVDLITYREWTEAEKSEYIVTQTKISNYNLARLQNECDRTEENKKQIKAYIKHKNLDIILK
jgi:hypothetical protein